MATLNSFEATKDWQEITGVSGVSGNFAIMNKSSQDILLYLGDTPVDNDSFIIVGLRYQGASSNVDIDNTVNTEKVWVKKTGVDNRKNALISINQA